MSNRPSKDVAAVSVHTVVVGRAGVGTMESQTIKDGVLIRDLRGDKMKGNSDSDPPNLDFFP